MQAGEASGDRDDAGQTRKYMCKDPNQLQCFELQPEKELP